MDKDEQVLHWIVNVIAFVLIGVPFLAVCLLALGGL